MSRIKVVIVDQDINYIIPIQKKFIKELFGQIDLVIIDDVSYFNTYFSNPQKIDILIIQEELYHSKICMHNIHHIFLLTEREEEIAKVSGNIYKLYKYSDISELFNKILKINSEELLIQYNSNKTQVIVVTSACGGVGKTTLSLAIAKALSDQYKRTLYIDAEYLQSFQILLKNVNPIENAEFYASIKMKNVDVYKLLKEKIGDNNFNYIPPFKSSLMSLGIDFSIYKEIISLIKESKDYDYIIVDTDSIMNENKVDLLDIADRVLIICKQNDYEMKATGHLMGNINRSNFDKYIFICNDIDEIKTNDFDLEKNIRVQEYIKHYLFNGEINIEDIAKDTGIQNIAMLLM